MKEKKRGIVDENSLFFNLLNTRLDMGHISLGFIINSLEVIFSNDGQASLSA